MSGKMKKNAHLEERNIFIFFFVDLAGTCRLCMIRHQREGSEMDLKTRQEIIDKIKACPIEKCGNPGLRNAQYEETKKLTINLIESMDENNQLIIQYEDGEEQLITVNVNNVLLSYDPIKVDDD